MPEKGHVRPGDLIVGSDSHTCAYGALVHSQPGSVALIWPLFLQLESSGSVCLRRLDLKLKESCKMCLPKDVILHLIGDVGVEGARYMTAEFCGSTVRNMDIPGRMTMSNMAIEMGGKAGIVEAIRPLKNT